MEFFGIEAWYIFFVEFPDVLQVRPDGGLFQENQSHGRDPRGRGVAWIQQESNIRLLSCISHVGR